MGDWQIPWALAGLWNEWADLATGEVLPSYTVITQNCDGHPVSGLMYWTEKIHTGDTQRRSH